jgi:hypothetical protein
MLPLRTLAACSVVVVMLALLAALNDTRPSALADTDDTLVSLTGDTSISAGTGPHGLYKAAVYNEAADEYLVVWQSNRSAGGTDIVARRVDGAGLPQGAVIPVTNDDHSQSFPVVAYNTIHQEYLIAWCEESASPNPVVGQRLRGDGSLIGAATSLASPGCAGTKRPTLAYNTRSDEYLVVWDGTAPSSQPGAFDIVGRRVGADALPIAESFTIGSGPGRRRGASVAYNTVRGEYLVAWLDERAGSGMEIYAQRVRGDGTLEGGNAPAVTSINSSSWPGLAYNDTDDQYLLTWNDTVSRQFSSQLMSAGAATVGVSNTLDIAADTYALSTAVYSRSRHEYLVAWGSGQVSISNTVRAQRISAAGSDIGAAQALPAAVEGRLFPVVVAGRGGDRYLAIWSHAGVEGRLFGFASPPTATPTHTATPTATLAPTASATPSMTAAATSAVVIDGTPTLTPSAQHLLLPAVVR